MITVALMLLGACALDDPWTRLEGTQPAQWRLVWTTSPAHEVTVSWTTLEAGTSHKVHVRPRPGSQGLESTSVPSGQGERRAREVMAHRSGAYTLSPTEVEKEAGAFYHHARVTGLQASSAYWLQIESDGRLSPELHFLTAPAEDRPFKMVHGGDSRTGISERQEMNRFIGRLADEHPELISFAHGGDYIANGRLWGHWRLWLSQNEWTTSPSGRVLPMIPTRGNHEPGPIFDEVFDDPGGAGLNYFSTDLTPQVSLITLNTEISAAGDQAVWLERELQRLRPQRRWLLSQYHRALYPAVKDPASAKLHWVPLFEEHNVDLVLESDGHSVKRTVPIRAEKVDPSGVIYIGEGGLGVPQRTPKSDRWFLQEPGMSGKSHHVVLLEFGPAGLDSRILAPPAVSSPIFRPEEQPLALAPDAPWRFLAGADPAGASWREVGFDDSSWAQGTGGFGYGDDDDVTVLDTMRGEYSRLYLRALVDPAALASLEEVQLAIRYDDAFIAFLGGVEVARAGVATGHGATAEGLSSHEATRWELFSLGSGAQLAERLGPGPAVLALEGHNHTSASSDFTLHPCLVGPSRVRAVAMDGPVVLDEFRLTPRDER
ncbi:MAG: metallophosphoesterase family protein [Planctomycetota bacterium]|nr:metallophosphoesterase family protein [Planctomycetota bacterium]